MRADQVVVPALPILLPLGCVLMAGSWALLRWRGRLTGGRLAAAWLAGWYAVAVVGATLLPLHLSWGAAAGPPEWFRINPIPFVVLRPSDFVLNVMMTVPLAAILQVLSGIGERARVLRVALLLSAAIEVTQCVLILTVHGNRWAEANDLIANVLGAYLGYLAFQRMLRIPAVRRAADSGSAVQSRA
jgi:glycopeptide antibiotics resistance protein